MPTTRRQPPAQDQQRRSPWGVLGLAGAACAACCAGPVLAATGGAGAIVAGLAGLVWPAAGLLVAALAAAGVVMRRRRRRGPCSVGAGCTVRSVPGCGVEPRDRARVTGTAASRSAP